MKKIILLLSLCFAAISCDLGLNPDNQSGGLGYSVNGNVQKGPFTQGTSITIQALDDALNPTGKNYQTKTVDDAGTFGIDNQIDSRYVEIIATGYYFNEISGRVSNSTITLRALSDLTESGKTNVNLLTTLEIDRVRHLVVSEGMSVSQAREMAEKELFDSFHIPEIVSVSESFDKMDITRGGDANAILLAISATLQGKRSEGELSELVAKIAAELRTAGKIDNASIQTQIRDGGMSVDAPSVRRNLENRYKSLGITDYEIPPFEDYLDVNGNGVIDKHDSWLILSKKDVFISDEGGSFDIEVQHNLTYDVMIEVDSDGWISQDVTKSYLETDKLSFTVSANEDYDPRCARIVVKDRNSELVEYVNVTQKQHDALAVTPNRINLSRDGGTFEIEIKANVDVSVEIPEYAQSWITQEPSTKGLVSSVLKFFVTRNDEPLQRHGEIILKSGELTEKIVVYQAGERVLLLDESDFVVSSKGQNVVVHVTSNIGYDVVMPSVDWIYRTSPTRALVSDELVFGIRANDGYDDREAQIIIQAAGKHAVINITQMQKDAIILAKNRYEFDNNGGELALEVQTNVALGVEIADESKDWIKQIPQTKGLETKTLNFKIMPNTSYDERTGFIRIANSEAKLQRSIRISQGQTNAIILSESNFDFSDAGGSFSVTASSNVTYEMTIGASWLHWVQTKGLTDNSYEFIVDKNTTYDSREATVTFTDKTTGASGVVTVKQSQKDAIILGSNKYSLPYEGGTVAVKLKSNVKYDVEVADNAAGWISYVPTTKALTESVVSLSVAKNEDIIERTGTVTIRNTTSGISNTVTITQTGNTETFVVNVPTAGTLSTILTDIQKANIVSMKVTGIINKDDFKTMEKMPKLTELDLGEVKVAGNIIPDEAMTERSSVGSIGFYKTDSKLERLVLPTDIISIGNGAFAIHSLKDVSLPASLTSIKESAFEGASLGRIDIPDNVTIIGKLAFSCCRELTEVKFSPNSKLRRIESVMGGDGIGNTVTDGAFNCCSSLKRFEIPASVSVIGAGTFYNCTALEELVIPENTSLTRITGYVYRDEYVLGAKTQTAGIVEGCYALKTLRIPAKVRTINNYAFANCGIETVIFEEGSLCQKIGDAVFANCVNLKNINIPESVKTLGNCVFVNCMSLESLDLSQFTSVGRTLISGCSSLKSIVLPDYMTELSDSYLEDCASLEYCILPTKLIKIGNEAFRGCSNLKKIDFPESLTTIMYNAFENCKSLSSIKIPSNVTIIAGHAFSKCQNLKEFFLSDNENITIGFGCFEDCKNLETIRLNAKKIKLEPYFLQNTAVSKITISSITESLTGEFWDNNGRGTWTGSLVNEFVFESPSHLTSVGNNAFAGAQITSLVLPETVTELYGGIFYGCTALFDWEIPSHVKKLASGSVFIGSSIIEPKISKDAHLEYIGDDAFSGISGLTEVDISEATYMGEYVFYNCADLQKVKLPANLTKLPGYTFYGCPLLETVELPESVTEIGFGAFGGCNSLSSVNTSNVKTIGGEAFEDCGLLTSVDCSSANTIGGRAFANCSSLESVKLLKSGDLFIGGCAFLWCRNLQTITIPAGVTSLAGGEDCLYHEDGLRDNNGWSFTGTDAEIVIEDNSSLTTLYNGAFAGASSLTEITLPNVEKIVKHSSNVGIFKGCQNLKKVHFPALKTAYPYTIFYDAGDSFCQCPSLEGIEMPVLEEITMDCIYGYINAPSFKKIILPKTVKKVYWGHLSSFCEINGSATRQFDEIICLATTPPLFETWRGEETLDYVLRVPSECVEAYQAAEDWNKFKTILPIEE